MKNAVVNAQNYRYFVLKDGILDVLKSSRRTLGSPDLLRELNDVSEKVLLATLSQRNVATVIIAHKETATKKECLMPSAAPHSEAHSVVRLMGCYHWNHRDCWRDIPAMITKVNETQATNS